MLFNQSAFGQSGTGKQIADSAKVYKKIETYSKRSGFTKFIYGILFEPVESTHVKIPKERKKKFQKSYKFYEGKTIRKIEIELHNS